MDNNEKSPRLGIGGWITLVVLGAFLVVAIVCAVNAWSGLDGTSMSGMGWLFLILGIVFTIAVGGGLMALVFYSSRHHYDR